MRVIVAGSRDITDLAVVEQAIQKSGFHVTELVSGGAKGVDRLGETWAKERNIAVTVFKPDWKRYGRGAGPRRNAAMAEYADGLVAVWDGRSRGTKSMIEQAEKRGLAIHIELVEKPDEVREAVTAYHAFAG